MVWLILGFYGFYNNVWWNIYIYFLLKIKWLIGRFFFVVLKLLFVVVFFYCWIDVIDIVICFKMFVLCVFVLIVY